MNVKIRTIFGSAVIAMLAVSVEVQAQATDVDCNGCVDTGDIANQAVNRSKFSNGAVGTAQIGNQQVIRGKFANGAVGTSQIGSQQVTSSKFAPGAVGFGQIGTFQVTEDKIADKAVSGTKLAAGAVSVDPALIRRSGAVQDCRWNLSGLSATGYWDSTISGECSGVASVKLPDRVNVTGLECTFFNGADAIANMNARLVRTNRASQASTPIFITNFTVPDDTIQTVSDFVPQDNGLTFVNNGLYSYRVVVFWANGSDGVESQFSGCAISYE